MKKRVLFYCPDRPAIVAHDSRDDTAMRMKHYRKSGQHVLKRIALHEYLVTLNYPGAPSAIININHA